MTELGWKPPELINEGGHAVSDDFMGGDSLTSAKFDTVGTVVKGLIIDGPHKQQQRDFATGKPKTYDDGNPMLQWKIVLSTEPDGDEDDGVRALYAKGQLHQAIKEAVRNANASGIEVGGTLSVKYEGDGEPARAGFNAPKMYRAKYEPPVANTPDPTDDF